MLYLKEEIREGKYTITELSSDNVFSICPICGEEAPVIDFENIIMRDDFNFSKSVCCPACTRAIHKRGLAALMDERLKDLTDTLQGYEKEGESIEPLSTHTAGTI